jgi:hypothetical protein
MGSLVRSEKARQSCTKFLHQVPAPSSGSKFWRHVRPREAADFTRCAAAAPDDALSALQCGTLPTDWGKGRMRRAAQSPMVRGIIAKETLW